MAHKRSAEDSTEPQAQKRVKKGFNVGPQNLPDGIHKRKVDKIRRKLVENAKIKRSYDRIKGKEEHKAEREQAGDDIDQPAPITRHPDRQALVEDDAESKSTALRTTDVDADPDHSINGRPNRRPRPQLYERERKTANAKAQELIERREAIAAAHVERDKRLAQRERWRRTIANSRGDGRRQKLGKQSTVLLEKIKRDLEREQAAN